MIGYPVSGLWRTLSHSLHVNVLELVAVLMTLPGLMSKLMGHVVQIEVTRQLWHTSITRVGTTLWSLTQQFVSSFWVLAHQVQVVHRPGLDNVLVGYFSQIRSGPTEWSLLPSVCQSLFQL